MHTYLDKSSKKSTDTIQQKKTNASNETIQRKSENNTRLPMNLKANMEQMSGMNLDDVVVHHNSSKPAQMKALAYTQGSDIHIGPGQEQHLGHEAWHVVQQKQNRVAPTTQLKGVNINDNSALEHEADVMGAKAVQMKPFYDTPIQRKTLQRNANAIQMKKAKFATDGTSTHKGLRFGGDTLEYDENSKFAEELETFQRTDNGLELIEISKCKDKETKLQQFLKDNKYLTPIQLEASFKLAETKSKKASNMGFLTKYEIENTDLDDLTSTMSKIQKNSLLQHEKDNNNKIKEAINYLLYNDDIDSKAINFLENQTSSEEVGSTIAYGKQGVADLNKIFFKEFESNSVYSSGFTGCTMAIFQFTDKANEWYTTYRDALMVAHVAKNVTDKFYTLIDNQIITNVQFFVPNIMHDTSKNSNAFLGKIKKDGNNFLGISTEYTFSFDKQGNRKPVFSNTPMINDNLTSVKNSEQAQFNNLLQMMGGGLFDKTTNRHYHIEQFSTDVINKGLKEITNYRAIFNSVMVVLNRLKQPELEALPLPVQKWYQQKKDKK